ncbi:MAG TPA: hypothetical protein VNL71_17090 [Chloroflexota bacterium]|nr:hypothetical protein [Chloroflexota bacterium]
MKGTPLAAQEERLITRVPAEPGQEPAGQANQARDDARSVQEWRSDLFDAGRKAWNTGGAGGRDCKTQRASRQAIVALVTLSLDLVDTLDRERGRRTHRPESEVISRRSSTDGAMPSSVRTSS